MTILDYIIRILHAGDSNNLIYSIHAELFKVKIKNKT